MQVLAEYAAKLPPGSSASSSMPVLSNLGPKGARQQQQQHQNRTSQVAGIEVESHPEETFQQKRVGGEGYNARVCVSVRVLCVCVVFACMCVRV